jgi:hypothetical protein
MDPEFIKSWCADQWIRNYTINDDMSIDVRATIVIASFISKLPIKFRHTGNFILDNNNLTTFENFPKTIDGYLDVTNNNLRDIYNIPIVSGSIRINSNPVFSLVTLFIGRKDKNDWIHFFNDCDIIRDDYIIWDRLVFFYDYLDIQIDKLWEEKILEEYKIIK